MIELAKQLREKVDMLMEEHSRLKRENEFLIKENSQLRSTVFRLSELLKNNNKNAEDNSSEGLHVEELCRLGQESLQALESVKVDIEYCLAKLNEQVARHA
ncbi:MAG: hypothetical protein N2110_09690 [Flavobacteriales bacterium]|nr:hypothetical protein [Flavobacteriales bacterium]MCX7769274.1 hypothetical protein [Flavobacteriales bacterium]MDW8409989.1 hypothetical protein [Flavobacteriales bacterium]